MSTSGGSGPEGSIPVDSRDRSVILVTMKQRAISRIRLRSFKARYSPSLGWTLYSLVTAAAFRAAASFADSLESAMINGLLCVRRLRPVDAVKSERSTEPPSLTAKLRHQSMSKKLEIKYGKYCITSKVNYYRGTPTRVTGRYPHVVYYFRPGKYPIGYSKHRLLCRTRSWLPFSVSLLSSIKVRTRDCRHKP